MVAKSNLQSSKVLKVLIVFLVFTFSLLFYYREPIKQHKVTKAKMEMFKRMLTTEPEHWGDEFKEVYDSMIVEKADSVRISAH